MGKRGASTLRAFPGHADPAEGPGQAEQGRPVAGVGTGPRRARGWSLLIPQKHPLQAKTRLRVPDPLRRALVQAMLADTIDAAWRTPCVVRIYLLVDGLDRLSDLGPGVRWVSPIDVGDLPALNQKLAHAERVLRCGPAPAADLAVLPGDLPALRPGELQETLRRASGRGRSFLADWSGSGTTLLAAESTASLSPAFGVGSAQAHSSSGAEALSGDGLDSVRADVDTVSGLERARQLGIGRWTRAVVGT